jgi:hypothetical protein
MDQGSLAGVGNSGDSSDQDNIRGSRYACHKSASIVLFIKTHNSFGTFSDSTQVHGET